MKAIKIANRVVSPGVRVLVNASRPKPPATMQETGRVWSATASNANSPALTKYVADPRAVKPSTWS